MKTFAAIVLVMALSGCTEPQATNNYFEGKIKSISVVKDVFQNTETTYLSLDDGDAATTCDPVVTVTAATEISFIETDPAIHGSAADFKVGQTVRVSPASDPRDICPMQINATFIRIMELRP